MFIDLILIDKIPLLLSGIIAIVIAAISLRNYLIIKNWRLLALGISFICLATIHFVLVLILSLPMEDGGNILSTLSMSHLDLVLLLSSFGSALSLIILACVYGGRWNGGAIHIRWHQAAMMPVVGAIGAILIYGSMRSHYFWKDEAFLSILDRGWTTDIFILLWILVISSILTVFIIINLFNYQRVNGSSSTRIAMFGFIFIFIGQMSSLVLLNNRSVWVVSDIYYNLNIYLFIVGMIDLMGYLAFLFAILSVKVSNGNK